MKRRHFLQALAAAAPGAVLVTAGAQAYASPARRNHASGEPKVFHYDDGRHFSPLYQWAPPLEPGDFDFAVDQLVNSGVDTLLYSAGLEGGIVQYGSQVAQKWGDNVKTWTHPIFYRAARNLQQLVADGHDPMRILAERCHEKGLWFLPSVTVCIVGGKREQDLGYGRKSDFVFDNPQFEVGDDDHPDAARLGRFFLPTRMNFLHAEVRRERFAIVQELLTRYETDGVELDLSIDNEFGPFCRIEEVPKLAPQLTAWIREIREVARKAEQAQGRRKRVYVRIPAGSKSMWRIPGFEVDTWVSEKLVDGLVVMSPYKKETRENNLKMLDQAIDLEPAVKLTRGTSCRVLASYLVSMGRAIESQSTPPMTWAAALLAYKKGADGFGLGMDGWVPNGWPWTDDEYRVLRKLGHLELLETADKIYRVRSRASSSRGNAEPLFPLETPLLPLALSVGKPLELPFTIADELPRWQSLGRVKSVRICVHVTGVDIAGKDRVEVSLNGRPLPESIREGIDLHFRFLKGRTAGPYGFILEYSLPPELFPRKGKNTMAVTLTQRDPAIGAEVEVYDADCRIEYRHHRHHERDPVEY